MVEVKTADLLPLIRKAGELLASSLEGIGHLTCDEIQGVVDLLIAAGMDDVAADVVYSHGASGDNDTGDLHHDIYLANEGESGDGPVELAREFVAACKRGEPLRKFRFTLPDGRVMEDVSREGRDDYAQRIWANDYGQTCVCESWTAETGWTADEVITPQQ